MPDLGTYSFEVLSSYAVTLALLAALIWLSVSRARKVRRALEAAEARVKNG
ncbi:heme exporter protein CcmD [Ovoidimarina sediminis]|uniref:heme exporter protein CcmD n=1 Tax=Ovoidimarina sediminis TaxID=3079856 RepID=UPI0039773137